MLALRDKEDDFQDDRPHDPNFDIWHRMGYVVAKILHMRPLDILKNWSCPELLVAFGTYMNEFMLEKYNEYNTLSSEQKAKVKVKPFKYALKFITFDQLEQLNNSKSEDDVVNEKDMEEMMKMFMQGGGGLNG